MTEQIPEQKTEQIPEQASRWLLIGAPEDRRVAMFQAALVRHQRPPARVVSYQSLLAAEGDLSTWLVPGITHLRWESPGEGHEIQQRLIAWGAEAPAPGHIRRISAEQALALAPDFGRIRYAYQGFLGYQRLLGMAATQLAEHPQICQPNPPAEILAMFDKVTTHQRLTAAGVPCPVRLDEAQQVTDYDSLQAVMAEARCHQVFVKLRTGSSASGVVAYRRQGQREVAITSAEVVEEGGELRLYNSLRIRRYERSSEIRALFDALIAEGVVIERWIPKASTQGYSCDFRVVVIAGEARHVVLRLSRSPMTNLHLGNRRGDLGLLQRTLGDAQWAALVEVAVQGMRAFPGFHCAGIDLLCQPGFRAACVLEVNAFGDLLPRCVHRGEDTYGAQILALSDRDKELGPMS